MIIVYGFDDFLKHSPAGRVYYDISSKRVNRCGIPDIFVKLCIYGFSRDGELICYEEVKAIRWNGVDFETNLLDGLAEAERRAFEEMTEKAEKLGTENDLTVYNGRVKDSLKNEMFFRLNQKITDLEERMKALDVGSERPSSSDTRAEDIIIGS